MGSFTAVVAATSSKSGSSSYSFLLLIVLVFVGFYFLMIRPQQQGRFVSDGRLVKGQLGIWSSY